MSVSADPIDIYPGDDVLYYMDMTRRLEKGDDTIASVNSVEIQDAAGNALSGLAVDLGSLEPNDVEFDNWQGGPVSEGKAALFRCAGAVKGVDYYAAVNVTTANGDTFTRRGLFRCRIS